MLCTCPSRRCGSGQCKCLGVSHFSTKKDHNAMFVFLMQMKLRVSDPFLASVFFQLLEVLKV